MSLDDVNLEHVAAGIRSIGQMEMLIRTLEGVGRDAMEALEPPPAEPSNGRLPLQKTTYPPNQTPAEMNAIMALFAARNAGKVKVNKTENGEEPVPILTDEQLHDERI